MAQASRWPQLAACFARLGMPVAVVDLETTGGNMYEDRVTEVALLRFEGGKITQHQWLVNPEQPISPFITRLTGIDNEMVAAAPTFAELVPMLLPLLRGTLVVAHNSRFDYTFLRHEFRRAGIPFAAPALCTVQLSRRLYPEFHKHNLDSIIERFDLAVESRHRAMADVLVLADFLEKSIAQAGTQAWDEHSRALMNPKMLPTRLPAALAAQGDLEAATNLTTTTVAPHQVVTTHSLDTVIRFTSQRSGYAHLVLREVDQLNAETDIHQWRTVDSLLENRLDLHLRDTHRCFQRLRAIVLSAGALIGFVDSGITKAVKLMPSGRR